MAQFNADIALNVQSNGAERQVRKLEAAVGRVERASQGILSIDKQILGERRKLLTLSGRQADRAKKRVADLRLQRSELSLQRRELQGIVSLERRRARAATTGSGGSGGGDSGGIGAVAGFGLLGSLGIGERRAAEVQKLIPKIREQLDEQLDNLRKRDALSQRFFEINERVSDQQQKIGGRSREITKAEEKRAQAQFVLNRVQGQIAAKVFKTKEAQRAARLELEKAKIDVKEYTGQINRANAAIRLHDGYLGEARAALKAVNKEADAYENTLDKIARRRAGRAGIGKAAAAGAAFATIPGQDIIQAGGAGALIAGPQGAAVAAGVALTLKAADAAARYGRQIAISTAEIKKFEIALRGIAGNNTTAALGRLNEINDRYNATNRDTIKGFTQLLAAGKTAGITLEQQLKTYEGLVVANKALGGSQEDLKGILRATTQVFSKNKVQAEELRGQIGDRLPGAFGQFAKSIGISTAELDKRLRDGKVSAADFVKFATSYLGPNSEWEKSAKNIADAPEEAGARLERSMEQLEKALGPITRSIGSYFQTMANSIVQSITRVIDWVNRLSIATQETLVNSLISERTALTNRLAGMRANQGSGFGQSSPREIAAVEDQLKRTTKAARIAQDTLNKLRGVNQPTAATDPPTPDTTQDELSDKELRDLERLVKRINAARTAFADDSALLAIDRKIENAIRQGDRAAQITLKAERDILAVRQNAAKELVGVTDERLKQAVLGKASVEADRITLRAQTELLELDKQRTDEVNKQNEAWRRQGEELRAISTGALADIDKQIRTIKNKLTFGSDATFVDQIEDLVLNQGVPFSEAFDRVSELRAFSKELERIRYQTQQIDQIVNGIGTEFAGLFQTVITGTEDLNKALVNTLQSLSRILFQAGLTALGGNDGVGLFSILGGNFGGGRASGGPVTTGKSYVVGEKGPELFVPGRSGTIVPNGAASGVTLVNNNSIVVNNSGGELSPKAATQIARTVEAGTMAVLTRERRPGGLLTR